MNNEEVAIKETVKNYTMVVSDKDRDLFDEVFSDQDKCTLISVGTVFDGKEAIYNEFFNGALVNAYTSIKLVSESVKVQQLGDMAIVIFAYHTECINRSDDQPSGIKGVETQVMKKYGDKWKIVYVHYSQVI